MNRRKKITLVVLVTLACVFVFAIGVWAFFPWNAAGGYLMARLQRTAVDKSLYISYGKLEIDGVIAPKILLSNVIVDYALAQKKIDNVVITIHPISSLLSWGVNCSIALGQGELSIPGSSATWKGGNLTFVLSPSRIAMSNVAIEGDLSLNGGVDYSVANGTYTRNDLSIKLPPNFDSVMQSLAGQIPLQQKSPGMWGIRQ